MPKEPKDALTEGSDKQRETLQRYRDMEAAGLIEIQHVASEDGVVVMRTRILASDDPVITKLIAMHTELEAIASMEERPAEFRTAVEVAQVALTKAALLGGADPAAGRDAELDQLSSVARALAALKGIRADDAGLRAQVYTLLEMLSNTIDVEALFEPQRNAAASLVSEFIAARAGTSRRASTDLLVEVLAQMHPEGGRPKGSCTGAPAQDTPSERKWRNLHTLFGQLGIAGSSPEALRREISATLKGNGK